MFCKYRPRSVVQDATNRLLLIPKYPSGLLRKSKPQLRGPSCTVQKYADYSSKFGLAFLMSTNAIGVHFNDNSIMLRAPKSDTFLYLRIMKTGHKRTDHFHESRLDLIPKNRRYKVDLFLEFEKQLQPHRKDSQQPDSADPDSACVTSWKRTKHALLFYINVHSVQVNFRDHTKLHIDSLATAEGSRVVTCTSSEHRTTFYESQLHKTPADVQQRYKYAMEVHNGNLEADFVYPNPFSAQLVSSSDSQSHVPDFHPREPVNPEGSPA